MNNGDRLIAKDSAVYIPASERDHMVATLHLTHASADSMLLNAKDRVWWPGIRAALHKKYSECKECSMFRISQTRPSNECSFKDLFQNFYPNTKNQKPKTKNQKPKTKNQKPKTKNKKQKTKTKNQKQKTKNQKPKTKNQNQNKK